MQRGVIIQHRRSWTLVYYDTQIRNGKRKGVSVTLKKKLAAISTEYPTKRSVRHLADEVLFADGIGSNSNQNPVR